MNVFPQNIHQLAASSSTSSASAAATTSASPAVPADPSSLLISSIAGAVDSIFGTIGDAIKGKTKRDLMRQQGNQLLIGQTLSMHEKRMQYAKPIAQKTNHSPMLILGLVSFFVFIILLFTLKKP